MKMKINNNVKIIEIEYNQVMQFCGFNVNEKNKVIETIKSILLVLNIWNMRKILNVK